MGNVKGKEPGVFKQSDLIDLGINQVREYPGGCSSPTAPNFNYQTACAGGGFSFPDNKEYSFTTGDQCSACGFYGYNNTACAFNDTSGGGAECECVSSNGSSTGRRCAVRRVAYRGNPAACCLIGASSSQTYNTTGDHWALRPNIKNEWWKIIGDSDYTCDPDATRNCLLQPGTAVTEVAKVCSTLDYEGTKRAWYKQNPTPTEPNGYCYNFVNNAQSQVGKIVLTAAIHEMATSPNYREFGKDNPPNAQMINTLLGLCSTGSAAGVCDGDLANMCSTYTRQDILDAYNKYIQNNNDIASKNLYQACGCHLKPSEYNEWAKVGVDETNVACDPICMLPDVVKQFVNNTQATCNQNLCVIDNVSIDILNSQTGNINFNVVCGNCGGSSGQTCRCIFGDISIFQSGSNTGALNFQQNCGGNCQIPDPKQFGNFINIDCNTGIPNGGPTPSGGGIWNTIKEWFSNNALFVLTVLSIVIVCFIAWLWWYNQPLPPKKLLGDQITLNDLFGGNFEDSF